MYDESVKTVNLTYDEAKLLEGLLVDLLDTGISVGENVTIEELYKKIKL